MFLVLAFYFNFFYFLSVINIQYNIIKEKV
jgi:hypothetical protein